jgi:lipopolysaccharide heptosyltransferase I
MFGCGIEQPLALRTFERILLIKPSALGDVIHALPVLAKLRERYPEARIDWLLTPAIAELVAHHPALSRVVLFDRRRYSHAWRSPGAARDLMRLFSQLRGGRYDLVIDLHGQFRSAVFALATRAAVRVGFDRPRRAIRRSSRRSLPAQSYRHGWTGAREGSWLAYTHRIPIPTLDAHAADRYLWLAPMLGLNSASQPDFRVPIPPIARLRVDQLLASAGVAIDQPLAVLTPGTVWETKHWRAEGFADVARHLLRGGRAVVLAGAGKDAAACQAVAKLCPQAVNVCDRTHVSELAALIARADICVTNDSGPMHLAAALGRPLVSIFGPTDEIWIGPYARPRAVIRAPGVACAPCYLRRLRECPNLHACMARVSSAEVIARVDEALPNARLARADSRSPAPRERAEHAVEFVGQCAEHGGRL